VPSPPETDPVLRHARREAIIIGLTWTGWRDHLLLCLFVLLGYDHPGHKLGKDDVKPILGVRCGSLERSVPGASARCSVLVRGFYMADDDLAATIRSSLKGTSARGALDE